MNAKEIKIPIDGTYMNVIRFGEGKQHLVIISGLTLLGLEGKGGALAAEYSDFGENYDVALVERRKDVPETFSTEDMAEDIFRVMTDIGFDTADIIGVSQGGMIALSLAAEHPEAVRRLIICSSSARTDKESRAVFEKWLSLAKDTDISHLNHEMFRDIYSGSYIKAYEEEFRFIETLGSNEDKKRFISLCRALLFTDLTAKLENIKAKTLVIGSGEDKIFSPSLSEELAAALGCEIYIYPHGSHAAYDEEADYKKRLLAFLGEVSVS